jgi:hypothetical protein
VIVALDLTDDPDGGGVVRVAEYDESGTSSAGASGVTFTRKGERAPSAFLPILDVVVEYWHHEVYRIGE